MAEQLFEVPEPVAPVSAAVLLDVVADAEAAERREAVRKLEAVLAWAHAHPVTDGDIPASWEADRSMFQQGEDRLGGEGTPAVVEFAVEQLATRLGISSFAAMSLVGDVLDLAHRHPVLWRRVKAGACATWTARSIAHDCSTLPVEAAAWVDTQIGHLAGRCTKKKIDSTLAYAIATWDPEKTRKAEEQARDARHLDLELPGQIPPQLGRHRRPPRPAVPDRRDQVRRPGGGEGRRARRGG